MSERNAILDNLLAELGAIDGYTPGQIIDGPVDHTLVRADPLAFVIQLREPSEHNGSGRRTSRTLRVLIAYLMKISDAPDAGSERVQLNSAYDGFHAGVEAINEREHALLRIFEDEGGPWFVGFGDNDRRVGALCYWHIPYTRKLGKPSN